VTITNQGNLLEVAEVKLYGNTLKDTHRFEIGPGETRTYTFQVVFPREGSQELVAIVGNKIVSQTVQVSRLLDRSNL
jgi:hypothetical protein